MQGGGEGLNKPSSAPQASWSTKGVFNTSGLLDLEGISSRSISKLIDGEGEGASTGASIPPSKYGDIEIDSTGVNEIIF